MVHTLFPLPEANTFVPDPVGCFQRASDREVNVNDMHEANRRQWDLMAAQWKAQRDDNWRRCLADPSLGFERGALQLLRQYVGQDLSGKTACVLGSGDNYAVFALAGMGAQVTSVDISQAQLDVAAERAAELGVNVTFVRGDVTNLPTLAGGVFDLVCSTNGVMVWITDPAAYYAEACRILRPGGIFLSYDIHPFQRPWNDPPEPFGMLKPYFDSGPKEWLDDPETGKAVMASEASLGERAGRASTFKCHWTVGELLMAMLGSGLELLYILEDPDTNPGFWLPDATDEDTDLIDWRKNPRAGLPVWLTLVARKP
jgi:SAM-dependent methyltransferase